MTFSSTFFRRLFINAYYRVSILFFGRPKKEFLRHLLKRYSVPDQLNWLEKIRVSAFAEDLNHFAIDQDLWRMRGQDNPYVDYSSLEKYEVEFEGVFDRNHYEPGGLVYSQGFLLYSLIRTHKPEIFFESGTMNGVSASLIAEALKKNQEENPKSNPKLYCLSLFEGDQLKRATERLKRFAFAKIIEGPSQKTIHEFAKKYGDRRVAFFIDGPKARSKAWDELLQFISNHFTNILFLAFDAVQEHVPYHSPFTESSGNSYNLRRGINSERQKAFEVYENLFKKNGYAFFIPDNQFSRRYYRFDDRIYQIRNKSWGSNFPWGPYRVDKIPNHIAYSYKLGCIYRSQNT